MSIGRMANIILRLINKIVWPCELVAGAQQGHLIESVFFFLISCVA